MPNYTTIDFPQLLVCLGIKDTMAFCSSRGDIKGGTFKQQVVPVEDALKRLAMFGPYDNYWFGVNELKPGATRRTKHDVARLTSLYLDLDVKEGSFNDIEACEHFAMMAGHFVGRPADIIIASGGGLQPLWILEDTPARRDPEGIEAELLNFKLDMLALADAVGVSIDTVFDSSRILRVPGTLNHKYNSKPATSAVALDVTK